MRWMSGILYWRNRLLAGDDSRGNEGSFLPLHPAFFFICALLTNKLRLTDMLGLPINSSMNRKEKVQVLKNYIQDLEVCSQRLR